MYRERAKASKLIPKRSLRINRTIYPVSSKMMVKIWTDCAGDGIALSIRVLKKALTWAADTGITLRKVKGGVDGSGAGA